MLTGDRKLVADHIASEMAIENKYVYAELFPQDKLDLVLSMRDSHKNVCHVGDGVNDGPALAASDVGVAMGVAGTAVAIETANIALFTSDLRQLAFALRLSRASVRTIFINVVFSMIFKLTIIILAFTLGVSLWVAVLGDVGSCMLVILYSMTILRLGKREEQKANQSLKGKSGSQHSKSLCGHACNGKHGHHHSLNQGQFGGPLKKDDCSKKCCGVESVARSHTQDQSRDSCCGSDKQTHENSSHCCGGGKVHQIQIKDVWCSAVEPQKISDCSKGCCDSGKVHQIQIKDVWCSAVKPQKTNDCSKSCCDSGNSKSKLHQIQIKDVWCSAVKPQKTNDCSKECCGSDNGNSNGKSKFNKSKIFFWVGQQHKFKAEDVGADKLSSNKKHNKKPSRYVQDDDHGSGSDGSCEDSLHECSDRQQLLENSTRSSKFWNEKLDKLLTDLYSPSDKQSKHAFCENERFLQSLIQTR
eukprot:TRINITY_DN2024_c1_g2_i7.p1 TRINITY_DN2024_c1_g2~~TRINITY_DN2024_c1_g2_i7.p1  ORF type:complete len:471 (+),score=76.66 TRINITY_DN2024_c1_g2_i7:349-1761(+)